MRPGELGHLEIIHWEDPGFRAMFERRITPTNLDGWLGLTDVGGPIVVFEVKRRGVSGPKGQARAFQCFRRNLTSGCRFIFMEHSSANGHVFPADITGWEAYICGPRGEDFAEDHGLDVFTLTRYVSSLDPFGRLNGSRI